ncbi:TRAP transporter small permease [Pseudorhodobacter wandonensis]|jgi:TRAP-type C4-dicarboxylate transport system permease small subunit|uniref:TRAP transporter small permease n=1 Tax=Pseudorhodobacter wandonensis TaxID=1120568 RepID=UPI0009E362BE|nr:TRAP transporter small permease [Pseudorhodobacter wandonensis]
MTALSKFVRHTENAVTFMALLMLVLCVLWGVFTRYISTQPAAWTGELSGILFTWVVFIGAATAFRDGRHIRVDLLVEMLPSRAAWALRLLADLIVVAFLAYSTFLSVQMLMQGASRVSPVLRIPFSWVYLAPAIAFGLMTIAAALRLLGLAAAPAPIAPEDTL